VVAPAIVTIAATESAIVPVAISTQSVVAASQCRQ